MRLQQVTPAAVTDLRCALGGSDDVGQQHGRQHAVGFRASSDSGQKLLDLVDDLVGVDPREVVFPGELDEARARNAIGDIPPLVDSGIAVPAAM